jgi:uncharacterized protein
MRKLFLDIETSPNLGYVWRLWNQNVSLSQLVESTEMLCFAWKWSGEPASATGFIDRRDGVGIMRDKAWQLLNEADVVVHYNGRRFDIPHLNREMLEGGYDPPSPYKQIDLLETARKKFKFPSNKLDYVTQALGLPGKATHEGFDLWVKCMADDAAAWDRMRRYNIKDVVILERLYKRLLPWIDSHPSHAVLTDSHVCPSCGGGDLRREGWYYTQVSAYQRYQCRKCGRWSYTGKRVSGTQVRGIAA